MGALDIGELPGICRSKREWDSTAPPQRYNSLHVRSSGQSKPEAPAEVPEPACAAFRDPAPRHRLGFDPPPHQRRAALRGDGLAAVDARPQPVLGSGVPQNPVLRRPLARQAGAAGAAVVLLPPLLRRHSLPVPRPGQGRGEGHRDPDQLDRARREPRADRAAWIDAVVTRVVTGAHYGLRDWLAQRITAVIMAIYSVIAVAVFILNKNITYSVWRDLFS